MTQWRATSQTGSYSEVRHKPDGGGLHPETLQWRNNVAPANHPRSLSESYINPRRWAFPGKAPESRWRRAHKLLTHAGLPSHTQQCHNPAAAYVRTVSNGTTASGPPDLHQRERVKSADRTKTAGAIQLHFSTPKNAF